jgi:hypothetical protein
MRLPAPTHTAKRYLMNFTRDTLAKSRVFCMLNIFTNSARVPEPAQGS